MTTKTENFLLRNIMYSRDFSSFVILISCTIPTACFYTFYQININPYSSLKIFHFFIHLFANFLMNHSKSIKTVFSLLCISFLVWNAQ